MIMGEPYGVRLARLSDARSLAIQVAAAHCLGIAVVAASGNDSGQRSGSASQSTPQTTPQPWPTPAQAEFPAIFPDAIAVAASCRERGRSCFSNQGEVAAPGGNGDDKCESGLGICKNNCQNRPDCGGDCPYGIIGPVTKSKDFESGYAYWAGTSFSAPLVSGLAALLLEKQKQGARIDIDDLIMAGTCGSKDGPGIINVPHALLAAPCPTPPAK